MDTLWPVVTTLIIIFWLFAGFCGYVMMYFCDKATGARLCLGEYFVIDIPVIGFIGALVAGLVSFAIGLNALVSWKEFTINLRNR